MKKKLQLYIHIPFCVKKCVYCDFLSAPAPKEVQDAYIRKLLEEIQHCGTQYSDYEASSIFIGGGTPSVLRTPQMQAVMEQLFSCFSVLADAEITIEANPGTLDAEKLAEYRTAGINRLSIGMQSALDEELKLLGRIHTHEQSVHNYRLAREAGFANINVDIISALPGQKISAYEKTLQKILELKPEHISAYSLMVAEGTPFYDRYRRAERLREQGKEQMLLPSEEAERQMYELTRQMLQAAGYVRYEISNYAQPAFECRHNSGYWTRQNYLGLGLGAASMIENVRFSNTADLQGYLALDFSGRHYAQWKVLDTKEQMEEFLFLGLRMMRGISFHAFERQFQVPLESVYGEVLERQIRQRLLEKTQTGCRLTDYGIDVSNYVMAQYLL